MPINGWTDKENIVCICFVVFHRKEEQIHAICRTADHYVQGEKPQKDKHCVLLFTYSVSGEGSRGTVWGGRGKEGREGGRAAKGDDHDQSKLCAPYKCHNERKYFAQLIHVDEK